MAQKTRLLIVEDEDSAEELFARIRVNYTMRVEHIEVHSSAWNQGIETLANRLGERSRHLSEMTDFHLFKLIPLQGRYVNGFGKAFGFVGEALDVRAFGGRHHHAVHLARAVHLVALRFVEAELQVTHRVAEALAVHDLLHAQLADELASW